MINSNDLVQWEEVGGAMAPIRAAPPFYWAPEVTYSEGRFYLYYSCGNEVNMELRVAVSDRPEGGFVDSGVRLTSEQFAIDPHVFIDDDGEKYLFYATDFLSHSHIGTGTVVDRMLDWDRLEGKPRPVTRAKYDWQVYDPSRPEKGNVRWHTVEGPSVLKRKDKYFQMFSGGNWKNESYGVGYAVSESLLNSEEWEQSIDGTTILPILRSVGNVLGPGHNSVVLGPNSRELFCVYHSWVNEERVMSIDRTDIVDDRMILLGPTVFAQPSPFLPGSVSQPDESGNRIFDNVSANFLLETTFRLLENADRLRVSISGGNRSRIAELELSGGRVNLHPGMDGDPLMRIPSGSDFSNYQCLWIEINGPRLQLTLNGRPWHLTTITPGSDEIRIEVAHSKGVDILNLDLTEGFVDFLEGAENFQESGWQSLSDDTVISSSMESLAIRRTGGDLSIAAKGSCFSEFEFAANVRPLLDPAFGFALLSRDDEIEMLIEFSSTEAPPSIETTIRRETVSLRAAFDASRYTQFRFVKLDGYLTVDLEGTSLAHFKVSSDPSRIGIVTNGGLSVDMVRAIRTG